MTSACDETSNLRLNYPEPRTLRFNPFRRLPGPRSIAHISGQLCVKCLQLDKSQTIHISCALLSYSVRVSRLKLGPKGTYPGKKHHRNFRNRRNLPFRPDLFVTSHIFFETPLSHSTRIEPDHSLGSPWGTYYKALSSR